MHKNLDLPLSLQDHYERYRERYDRLIAQIRASNLKLMVAYMIGVVPIPSFEK